MGKQGKPVNQVTHDDGTIDTRYTVIKQYAWSMYFCGEWCSAHLTEADAWAEAAAHKARRMADIDAQLQAWAHTIR